VWTLLILFVTNRCLSATRIYRVISRKQLLPHLLPCHLHIQRRTRVLLRLYGFLTFGYADATMVRHFMVTNGLRNRRTHCRLPPCGDERLIPCCCIRGGVSAAERCCAAGVPFSSRSWRAPASGDQRQEQPLLPGVAAGCRRAYRWANIPAGLSFLRTLDALCDTIFCN